MPTYEYRCAKCGEELEVFQTFAETPLTKHKGCGGKLAKVLSPAGIVLKGSGFYKTDNRSSSKRSGGSDSRSSESRSSESGSSGESKSSESSGSALRARRLGIGSSGDSKKRLLELRVGLGVGRLGLGRSGGLEEARGQERLTGRGPGGRRRRVRGVGLLQLPRRRRRGRDRHPVRRARATRSRSARSATRGWRSSRGTAATTGTRRRRCRPAPTSGRCAPSACAR